MPVSTVPFAWTDLRERLPRASDLIEGPTNAQSILRLFGQPEDAVRVTLYRDHHAWCPYCQKIWLWLEEKRIPYRVRKVTMVCYGEKELWYRSLVPSGMLPALELDGRLFTESDHILLRLEECFGPLGPLMASPESQRLRRLERSLFRAWCQWLCDPATLSPSADERARLAFEREARAVEAALACHPGPFFFPDLSTVDLLFVPYLERMSASLAYYKGYGLRQRFPSIDRWFRALEQRPTYLGTQSDFHTHAHDLPPQMGGCYASGTQEQRAVAHRIDQGPWPIGEAGDPDPETSQPPPAEAAVLALSRVLRHRHALVARNPLAADIFEPALLCALTHLVSGHDCPPPPGTAGGLRYLRDRICVPRDMPLHAARLLRQSLERTAGLDPADPTAQAEAIPVRHRRDQDPLPFRRESMHPASAVAASC